MYPLESDGRNDIVVFDAPGKPQQPRFAEDVFVQIAEASGPHDLVTSNALDRALSVFASVVRGLRRTESFRVVARVLSERDTTRTAFRKNLVREVEDLRPKWRFDDPADIEIWAAQTAPEQWRSAIRLTRKRSRRMVEREGALRPSVAAAMVHLAGPPGLLLDPCCGSGTIVMEARDIGWRAFGSDLDPSIARRNGVSVVQADARRLPFGDSSYDAVVSNLPFGGKFELTEGLTEDFLRVAPTCVLLVPDTPENAKRVIDVTLLGRAVKLVVVTR